MKNIDKAIIQAKKDLQEYINSTDDEYIIGYNEGYIEALEYVKNELKWMVK